MLLPWNLAWPQMLLYKRPSNLVICTMLDRGDIREKKFEKVQEICVSIHCKPLHFVISYKTWSWYCWVNRKCTIFRPVLNYRSSGIVGLFKFRFNSRKLESK